MNLIQRIQIGTTIIAMVCACAVTVHAFDDDDGEMTFGVEEVEEDLDYLDDLIEEGQSLYEQGSYEEASLRFFDVLETHDPGADAYHPQAQYELGRTLLRLELYQGALSYFGQIAEEGDFHPYFQSGLRGLLLLTEAIPGDMTLAEHLARYADHFPDMVPSDYQDRYAYLVGRQLFDDLELERAVELLGSVDEDSEYYARARYIMGIAYVADYEAEPAVDAFRQVLRYFEGLDTPFDELGNERQRLLDLTHMGMARVYYSTAQYDTSINYYDRIDRDSPRWPEALFESSWSAFHLDEFNRALGNLHSLNSPFFDDAYFPEGPILAAVIYFYNCNYNLVRDTLEDFDFIYEGVMEELEMILEEHPDPFTLYEWGERWRAGDVDGQPEFNSALRATLDDRQLRQRFELVDAIDAENESMEALSDTWQTSLLGDTLMQEAALAHSFATTDAGELVQRRLERVIAELDDLINQQNRILFEVARAEQGEVEAEIRAGMLIDDDVVDGPELDVTSEDMYWVFDGEYWKDELGYYYFDIRSECRR